MDTQKDIMQMTDDEKKDYLEELEDECLSLEIDVLCEKPDDDDGPFWENYLEGLEDCYDGTAAGIIFACICFLFKTFFYIYIILWGWGIFCAYQDHDSSIRDLDDMNVISRHGYMFSYEIFHE